LYLGCIVDNFLCDGLNLYILYFLRSDGLFCLKMGMIELSFFTKENESNNDALNVGLNICTKINDTITFLFTIMRDKAGIFQYAVEVRLSFGSILIVIDLYNLSCSIFFAVPFNIINSQSNIGVMDKSSNYI
jgi:hypothetical protein